MEYGRVCKVCKWVKYIGGAVWVCLVKQEICKNGVMMEVHPLQGGCDMWELRGSDIGEGVEKDEV